MTKLADANGLVDLIYDAALEPRLWATVMERLADLIGGNSGWLSQINVVDGSGGRAEDPVSRIDPVWPQRYIDHFVGRNPFATFTGDEGPYDFLRHWTPRVVTHDEQVPRDVLNRGEFYNDFLAPQDISSCMMIRLAKSGLETATMNINCSPRKDRFSPADIALASTLQPHLVRAFRLGRAIAEERQVSSAMARWPSTSAHGVFVLRERGRILHMNPAAEAMACGAAGLKVVGGRLAASAPEDGRRLDALICAALCDDADLRTGGAMAISSPRPIAVVVAPVSSETAAPYHVGPCAIVCASDLERRVELPRDRLRALFGLTGAEARLALALFNGANPRTAADAFGVSFQTVRNQLSSIYEKTGARGQSDLVGLLWRVVGD